MRAGAKRSRCAWGMTAGVWLAFVAAGAVRPAGAGEALGEAGREAWTRWLGLQALDAADTVAAPGTTLYPTLAPAGRSASLLTAVRAARDFEARQAGPSSRRPRGATSALAAARAYRQAAEYEKAVAWYGEAAAQADSTFDRREAAREAAAAAAARGDSAGFAPALARLLGADDLAPLADETVLAFRALLARDDATGLALLAARVDAQARPLAPDVLFWRAFAAAAGRDWARALAASREALADADAPLRLAPWQRRWVVGAVPDLLYLTGGADEAAELYRRLAAGGAEPQAGWSRYQLANFDLLAGRLRAAAAAYHALCAEADEEGRRPWRRRACALAALTDSLAALRGMDGAHGDARIAGR